MRLRLLALNVALLSILVGGSAFAQLSNSNYDTGVTLGSWTVAQFNPGWGSGPLDFTYATSGLSITPSQSAPGMAKSEWSGHNDSRNCSVFQNITTTAVQHNVTVWGQNVTSNGASTLSLRVADGHTGTWNGAAPTGTELANIPKTGGGDVWRLLTGTFTPAGTTWQVGVTWISGGSGAPFGITVAAADDWVVSPVMAVEDWMLY